MPKPKLKRIYEPWEASDGSRVLVERLWPRGLTKKAAKVDLWLQEIAPSPELRRWFGHDFERWPEFRRRYVAEIVANPAAFDRLRQMAQAGPLTLVYAARDPERNSARILLERLCAG